MKSIHTAPSARDVAGNRVTRKRPQNDRSGAKERELRSNPGRLKGELS